MSKTWRLKWRDAEKEKPEIGIGDGASDQVLILKTKGRDDMAVYEVTRWAHHTNGPYWINHYKDPTFRVIKWAYLPKNGVHDEYLELFSDTGQ